MTTAQLNLSGNAYTKVATAQKCLITIESGRARVFFGTTDPLPTDTGHLISGEADKMPCSLSNMEVLMNTYIKPIDIHEEATNPTCIIIVTAI